MSLTGLVNQGATCFLNTALQCFTHMPEIRDAFFRLSPAELGHYENDANNERRIPYEIQRLMVSLMLKPQTAVSSKRVTDSFGWANGVTQQDVQELCSVLLPALINSLTGTSGHSMIHELLYVKTVQKIECQGCGNITEKEADESTLFVQVEGFPSGLKASLYNSFCTAELMRGGNRYMCDTCNAYMNAKKMVKLRRLPPVLMIALNRFATTNTYQTYKVKDTFPYPMEINMSTYSEEKETEMMYELASVVVHLGRCDGGHYTACVRDIDALGHWELENEEPEKTAQSPSSAVKPDLRKCTDPKQVVATVLATALKSSMNITVDRLSVEIGKQTGTAWSRGFKKKWGPFQKFLKDNSDMFCVNGNLVTLTENSDATDGLEESEKNDNSCVENASDASSASGGSFPRINKSSHGKKGKKKMRTEKKPMMKQTVPPPPLGYRWFHFNDETVTPMLAQDLHNTFGGSESAYLLFYRRKNLQRPAEAQGNPAYGIPAVLMDAILNEGITTDSARNCQKETEPMPADANLWEEADIKSCGTSSNVSVSNEVHDDQNKNLQDTVKDLSANIMKQLPLTIRVPGLY